jgi:hypothetical protein
MAKFCTKCGSELVDGKCPKCKEEKSTTKEVVEVEAVDMKESFMDCLGILKKIFVKPIETVKEFVVENKFVTGIIMIVLTAIASGLNKIATLKSMYGASSGSRFNANDLSDYINSALSGGSFGPAKPDYFKEFMTTFAYNLVEYAVIALVGYLVITMLFKGKATIKEMFSVVGVAFSAVLVAYLLNSILVFIDGEVVGYIRSYVTTFGSIFSYLLIYEGIKKISGIDKEKLFLSVASMCIFATCVIDILHKIFK